MALATSVLMAWGLGRVALWLDESATVVATQRTWPNLAKLIQGPETPMVPYYAALKLFTGIVRQLVPVTVSHPEVLYRLPSVIVSVLAAWALIAWLGRICPPELVVSTGTILLLSGGFSRYAQEARPYAAILFVAVLSTIAWVRLVHDRSRRWLVAYTVSVVALISLSTLSGALILAHLTAAALACDRGQRRTALLRTAATAAIGLLIASPLAVLTAGHGKGPASFPALSFDHAKTVMVELFNLSPHPLLGVGPVILLAAVGLTRVNSPKYRFVARLAACWAIVPLAAMLLALTQRPNLLFGRYVLYVIPAWAILAGLGVVTLAELGRRAVARLPRLGSAGPAAAGYALTAAVLIAIAVGQTSTLTLVRGRAGHGEDIRPALASANLPQYAGLPIVMTYQLGAVEIATYNRADEGRLGGVKLQRNRKIIWPTIESTAAYQRYLKGQTRLVYFRRVKANSSCHQTLPITPAAEIDRCLPGVLRQQGFRATEVAPGGYGWTFAIIERTAP
jgi:mannosyltransferase